MRKHIQFWAYASTVVILAACGGGSDDETSTPSAPSLPTATAAVDKYLGAWATGCEWLRLPGVDPAHPNGLSEIETVAFTKVADTELSGVGVETQYGSTDCSGPVKSVTNYTLTVSLNGTVVIGSEVADKLLIEQSGATRKSIALVTDGRLYGADSTPPRDADGFPTALDTTRYSTKQ